MELHELINKFIEKNGYTSYLEIGVRECYTFDRVKCGDKVGIEPNMSVGTIRDSDGYIHNITSDEYFGVAEDYDISEGEVFDLILIDGLHLSEQVKRDIENSLNVLNKDGVILVHDVLPNDWKEETREQHGGSWTGDVWKGFLQTVLYRNDVNYYTIPDCKTGVGVIYFEDCPIKDKLDFQTYREYGRKLLRVQDS